MGTQGLHRSLNSEDEGKTIKVRVSFSDDAANQETVTSEPVGPVEQQASEPPPNNPATGKPTITGTAQVGETLTAVTTDIADADGLTGVSYSYQWIRTDGGTDTDIAGETGSTYELVSADVGKTIRVRVTFTDDSDNQETLTSAATAAVPPQLTASFSEKPDSHDGVNAFTFELHFSEEPDPGFSYKTLKFDAFTVKKGTLTKSRRMNKPSNMSWLIEIVPDGNDQVTVLLPKTNNCTDTGAICTEDGRKLSNENEFTVSRAGG